MRCNKRISLNKTSTAETYCMRDCDKTDPKTGLLYHDGDCEPSTIIHKHEIALYARGEYIADRNRG